MNCTCPGCKPKVTIDTVINVVASFLSLSLGVFMLASGAMCLASRDRELATVVIVACGAAATAVNVLAMVVKRHYAKRAAP